MTKTQRDRMRYFVLVALSVCSFLGVACNGGSPERDGHSGPDGSSLSFIDGGMTDASTSVVLSDAQADHNSDAVSLGNLDVPFVRPDVATTDGAYVPVDGTCGFAAPAFCETFEQGPMARAAGRAGELDSTRWSAARGGPWAHATLDEAFEVDPARIPSCRAGLPSAVLPNADALICDPVGTIRTRHLLTAAAAQNYGLNSYRIRQPFDFAGRTGTIKLDVDLTNSGLHGWPAIVISQDPSPAPSFDWEERGSGPRNGVEIEFRLGYCGTPSTVRPQIFAFRDYVQTAYMSPANDCGEPHGKTVRGSLNHVEIYVTQTHLEVWASDPSPDGMTFPNFQRLWAGDVTLPFGRGYVNLMVRNHATIKYWGGSAWVVRWDNVGFDGPVVSNWREHSAPDSLTVTRGLQGCLINGQCQWVGDVIPDHTSDVCNDTSEHCTFAGEGRNVGYVVPNSNEPPVRIEIPDVRLAGATQARLALAATYPYFMWSGMFPPATQLNLRHRVNGGPWHDRFITAQEVNAFVDYAPSIGGAGAGAGLLNQIIELDLRELRDGTNAIEFSASGTWTGAYRIGILGLDLVLTTGN